MDAARCPRKTVLARSKTFSGLSDGTLGRLLSGTTETHFKRGSVVFGRGTPATGIHVIAAGQIKLSIETPEGDEHVVELLRDGDCFGEAAMLTDRLHLLTAATVSDCTLLQVSRATVMAEIESDRELAKRLIRNLSDRLYLRTSDLENVLYRKAVARVARFLIEHLDDAEPAAAPVTAAPVHLPARKGLIASRLNMSQEHFSRTLRELSDRGYITVDGGDVSVHDARGLRELAV